MKIGFHASHEQFSPGTLLSHVIAAEQAGFDAAMCSDHLMPWSREQGHSGYTWSWLGAAMHATTLSFGMVTAPGYRYHPVILAQAAATLAEMFEGRLWVAVGSGEALNEHITGEKWPPKEERNERLVECATIMRALWAGETVTHRGHVTAVEARVYSLPREAPKLIGAAITEKTAAWMGGWADGMITVSGPRDRMQRVIAAFRENGGEGKPVLLQAKHSWAKSEADALVGAMDQWKTNVFPSPVAADLTMPEHFEELAASVSEEQVRQSVRISSDLSQHADWIRQDMELGCEALYIHNVNRKQPEFIEAFGEKVLPVVRK